MHTEPRPSRFSFATISPTASALWLDPRRVYSCAYKEQGSRAWHRAREAKARSHLQKLNAPAWRALLGHRLQLGRADLPGAAETLQIVRPWHRSCRATSSIILQRLIAEVAGAAGKVRIELRDYRKCDDRQRRFDRSALSACSGMRQRQSANTSTPLLHAQAWRAALDFMASRQRRCRQCGAGVPAWAKFINRYIFPGGELAHGSAACCMIPARSRLEMVDTEELRHLRAYAATWSRMWLEARLGQAQSILQASTTRKKPVKACACLSSLSGRLGHGLRAWAGCRASDAVQQTRWRSASRAYGEVRKAAIPFSPQIHLPMKSRSMPYKFRSRAAADLIMLDANGRQACWTSVGKSPDGVRSIITVGQIPAPPFVALEAAAA